ncbi:MAG: hypothetical protein HKN03_01220 [Acidimicrobiales bacterium]|nr:hypothetical protein [Acidimicrobiales bacterium]
MFGLGGMSRRLCGAQSLRRSIGALGIALLLSVPTVEAQTDDDDATTTVEDLRAEKRKIQADRVDNALQIDAATADINDLTEALSTLRGWMNNQQLVVAASRGRATSARAALDEAQAGVDLVTEEIDRLGGQIREEAVRAFLGGGHGGVLLETGDPTVAIRQESLSRHLRGTIDDLRDRLSVARQELVVGQQHVVDTSQAADEQQLQSEQALRELEEMSLEYQDLLIGSEERLDLLLSERQTLAELNETVGSELSKAEAQLVALLGAAGGPGAGRAELVFPSDIVDAGYGIKVHRDIAEDVRALLQAAQLDGINLGGGGYRDSSAQIRLRRANCGGSDYAIYEMPASRCRPPTARPGSSMHEQGRAIDFTYNGSLITRRSGPGWEWLSANASSYGLFNLPSEAWHFSTNGK